MIRLASIVLICAATAWAQEPPTPGQRLVELARELEGRPNDARLHAQIAVAYFERGAAGDATRVNAHVERAVELDPALESELEKSLAAASAGTEAQPLTAEANLADLQVANTLPQPGISKSNAAIKAKLAARLARSRFAAPSTQYSKNVEAVEKLFDPATDPEATTWADRTAELRRNLPPRLSPLTARFVETLRQTVQRRSEAAQRAKKNPDGDDPPDPMLTKGQAYLAYVDGGLDEAVRLLKTTAAASDTISKRLIEKGAPEDSERIAAAPRIAGAPRALGAPVDGAPVDDDWDDDSTAERARVRSGRRLVTLSRPDDDDGTPRRDDGTPSRNDPLTPQRTDDLEAPPRDQTPPRTDAQPPERTATPERTDPTPPARTQAPPRTDPAPPVRTDTPVRDGTAPVPRDQTPARTDPPPAPPEALRRIGEQALESIEATRTGEVPPKEVETKLRELAQTGEVGEPLVIDLDGDNAPAVPGGLAPDGRVDPRCAVRFDVDGDGHVDLVEWVRHGDGLLCVDADGDGRITSGRELPGALPGHGDGVAWLERRDLDGDGALTGRELAGLLIWKDDGDAQVQPGELVSVQSAGLTRIQIAGGTSADVAGQRRTVWEWWPDQAR